MFPEQQAPNAKLLKAQVIQTAPKSNANTVTNRVRNIDVRTPYKESQKQVLLQLLSIIPHVSIDNQRPRIQTQ